MRTKKSLFKHILLALSYITAVHADAQRKPLTEVHRAGAMRRVMMMGELSGTIFLDSIANKTHLFGIGPLEYLKGEILIWDGKPYYSTVTSNDQIEVTSSFKIKAPFFVYANVENWKEIPLPELVRTLGDLESYLDQVTPSDAKAFAFRISTIIDSAVIHVVNLPDGNHVSSPEDAHMGQLNFIVAGKAVDILGFFSRTDQGIFTHHLSYAHLHLLSRDRKSLGHVDKLLFKKGETKILVAQ